MPKKFCGVFAALTTPFLGDETSVEKFKENIQKYNSFDLSGYVVSGSTGESVHLSDDETERLVRAAKDSAAPGRKIIAGTARESTRMTISFTNRLAECGIDAALVRTPGYYTGKMNKQAFSRHYKELADKSRVPILIYNIPKYTGVTIDRDFLWDISSHPNVAGVKDSSGNLAFLGEVFSGLNDNFSFLLGAGSVFLPGIVQGADGGILALAAAVPRFCVELYRLAQEKRFEEARVLQHRLIPLNKAVTQTFGIPGLKYALDVLGFYGGPSRSPLLPLNEEEKKEMDDILAALKKLPM
ncbi:MAG: dihydrodipicolinate synthase family protein [Candidatus Aminicenantes bacterium]|nr:dihydrodipicolinate synthase family protein [Candidatus Aminicenantes bacterium]